MNMLPAVQDIGKKVVGFVSRESPTILTGLSIIGVVTTVALGINATPKYLLLKEWEENKRLKEQGIDYDRVTRVEALRLGWKCYIPTVGVGLATILCIVGSNRINLQRNAALATAYTLAEKGFKEYQEKVVEQIGKNKELKIKDSIAQDRLDKNPIYNNQIIVTGKGDTLIYDSLSGRYFKNDVENIRRIVNEFNRQLLSEMFLPLNDFYMELGLEGTEMGRNMGWDIERGFLEISFSSKLAANDVPCLVIDYKLAPRNVGIL